MIAKKWTLLTEHTPIAIYFHGATISKFGQLSIFGGKTMLKNKDIRSEKLFTIYVDIPPLKELAWLSILHYNNNFKDKTDCDLLRPSLPLTYFSRLID